ncbi:MAG: NAD(P)(+) transhydrogenase (Re/Si-specific) subunit beta [Porticoccaceae bacterium]|jgi:H+-translocating NAD(P) transhydrogenase subunit beta|nr:MAG: NAD synthetase [SAR92 bacterium BACL16 MAG-120619-bin48]KRP25937.1 MAG: NAD synthetase [SAR92 bacterium BACL16 MAG-120322-bin99]MDP4654786.1 NAD(P)(+) transhydrogenase (Re/Si-specific) subunit beta [Alphaproteobacteria bacterium]MDP4744764.1 NAD(P)(+) transhydrogenase (Re/Si-specific) subunit beta [Porticoccaceae bacterium]MDP4753206.1 NAD(P)(+) transhydrogenase (Re/Si-specific) subunit beta [Porticoccaceae bacterium]
MSIMSIIGFSYVVSATLFILGLKLLGSPATARKGNALSAIGMLIAVVVTLLDQGIVDFRYIAIAITVGGLIGLWAARSVAMTSMPEMVALLNGFGGVASLLVGWAAITPDASNLVLITIFLSILIGGVTFTGSIVAYGKLSEKLVGRAIMFKGQAIVNSLVIAAILIAAGLFVHDPLKTDYLYLAIGLSVVLGVLVVIPIGGADMPVVISLLNSYSGLAACAAGFAINNNLLIVAGALVGASGIILTQIMCRAMNRSLSNVLFSGFSAVKTMNMKIEGEVKPITPDDAYYMLEAASTIAIIPGYGMAVAQAQHAVKELQELLEANGAEVVYGVHPVAGRMPGHMNVLLAEADVSYDLLLEMADINPRMASVDVAIVIGANDVVNPAAREMEGSPIYGMPVINVDQARTVFVLKRSMASGFAGIDNPLFFKENTRMIFGDAKETLSHLIREFSN